MKALPPTLVAGLILLQSHCISFAGGSNCTSENLSVSHYESLNESLKPSVAARLSKSRPDQGNYRSFSARNNAGRSMKEESKSKAANTGDLSSGPFENYRSTNASSLSGPRDKNVNFELLASAKGNEYFSEVAFLDERTAVTIAHSKKQSWLLLVDISSSPMKVLSRISIPVGFCCHSDQMRTKEKFYIDQTNHSIIVPVNKTSEHVDKSGHLSWCASRKVTPGVWIIHPQHNSDQSWSLDPSAISVYYFSNEGWKKKHDIRILNAHPDENHNIWMSFSKGIVGVLPVQSGNAYATEVDLFNFNRDFALLGQVKNDFKEKLYLQLKNTVEDAKDTLELKKAIYKHPEAYLQQYRESVRYAVYSGLQREMNSGLDSNTYYEHPEALWKYVHTELDNPLDKKKSKLHNYAGYLIPDFQNIQNDLSSGKGSTVYLSTNLGIYQLSYDPKNKVQSEWGYIYQNSFVRKEAQKTATSGSTPVFIAERNEIAVCDNDFPQVNLLILNASNGQLKQQFRLFEYGYGSACENAVAYANQTLVAGNTFGYGCELNDKDDLPAKGVMKFYTAPGGKWRVDYDWNKLQQSALSNTAAPKFSDSGANVYLYHQPDTHKEWQLSSISVDKASAANPFRFSLQPDFKGVVKVVLDNYMSNFSFGPGKSALVGTSGGLLRIASE